MVFASFLLMLSSYASSVVRLLAERNFAFASVALSVVFNVSSVFKPLGLVIKLTVLPFSNLTPLKAATPKVTPFTSVFWLPFTVNMVSLLAMSDGR